MRTSTRSSILLRATGPSPRSGLLDTSVVVGLASDLEKARRREGLNWVRATLVSLDFDARCAQAYGRICGVLAVLGRKARGARSVDLTIAATALANHLAIYTFNAGDLRGLVEIVDLHRGRAS